MFYDVAKIAMIRLAFSRSQELAPIGCTAVALTPGWLHSEMMADAYGVTEGTWRAAPVIPGSAARRGRGSVRAPRPPSRGWDSRAVCSAGRGRR
jgi:NAD(P)-dependent dehydrogenase (short-subunit alcohol dehydrogenase family)